VTLTIPHQQRLPLAIAALGFLFLGLFLLYPLFNVFSASVLLDGEGEKFTFANYVKILGRPFYRGAVANTLMIGVAATLTTIVVSVPFAFALARLPVPGKAAIIALAAMPLVLPSFVSAYAIVLLLGRAGVVTQWLNSWGIGFGSIYGAGGIILVYTLTPLSLRAAADDGGLQGGRRLDRGSGAKPRLLTAPHLVDGDPAHRRALDPGRWPSGVHRDAGEFRRALRAGRGHADLRRRGFQAVRRRDRAQPVVGWRAGRAADPDDLAGAVDPAPLPGQPPLRHRCARRPADPAGRPRSAHRRNGLLLGGRAARAGAVLRHRRAVLHGVPRSGCFIPTSARPTSRPFSSVRRGRCSTR
jgi:hypothetical protein